MKHFFSLLLITAIHYSAAAQSAYWQQEVHYTIDVSLNDQEHSLDGFLKLQYINHSPDTLHYIWFHLWPNAFKNDQTAFSEQLLLDGRTDFYFSNKEKRGYINRLDFRINNNTLRVEDHPQFIDVVQVFFAGATGARRTNAYHHTLSCKAAGQFFERRTYRSVIPGYAMVSQTRGVRSQRLAPHALPRSGRIL